MSKLKILMVIICAFHSSITSLYCGINCEIPRNSVRIAYSRLPNNELTDNDNQVLVTVYANIPKLDRRTGLVYALVEFYESMSDDLLDNAEFLDLVSQEDCNNYSGYKLYTFSGYVSLSKNVVINEVNQVTIVNNPYLVRRPSDILSTSKSNGNTTRIGIPQSSLATKYVCNKAIRFPYILEPYLSTSCVNGEVVAQFYNPSGNMYISSPSNTTYKFFGIHSISFNSRFVVTNNNVVDIDVPNGRVVLSGITLKDGAKMRIRAKNVTIIDGDGYFHEVSFNSRLDIEAQEYIHIVGGLKINNGSNVEFNTNGYCNIDANSKTWGVRIAEKSGLTVRYCSTFNLTPQADLKTSYLAVMTKDRYKKDDCTVGRIVADRESFVYFDVGRYTCWWDYAVDNLISATSSFVIPSDGKKQLEDRVKRLAGDKTYTEFYNQLPEDSKKQGIIVQAVTQGTDFFGLAIFASFLDLLVPDNDCSDFFQRSKLRQLPSSNEINEAISNYISPNSDGINDKWDISEYLKFYPKTTVMIYNRWGNVVWQSDGVYQNNWGGENEKGEALPEGVYFYHLNTGEADVIPMTGFVEVMR